MSLKDTYDKIAEDWFAVHKVDSWWHEGIDKFISLVGQGGTVLDAGCGAAVKSKYLSQNGMKVTGVDFSEKMIGIAKREVPAAEFLVGDIKDLDFLNQKFDGIFAQAVLLHFPKDEISEVLNSLLSKLNPGGYIYIAVKAKRLDGPSETTITQNDFGYEFERFFSFFALEEIKGFVLKANLKIVYENTEDTDIDDWIQLIAQKLE
ncbi:MAG: hypothetical protein COT81_05600 [Candidatus Buchananbacteria bacterium CG10_big_fil_rev_8_21_14_0_10_42_9]|uniref:Methyltransferase domain-containing protein n=1 Tax=Candidatus Buchananbacteria bacterium CG10_big_fil_rev_8_21_14_0_10_42_9 TaxID=1974526 RepID=A0A2H0W288_9BACT|nr:MAG: hypothetical protein COT81_05600 [Candidatus Buchananbacteria bacterium CG10_big_fil_rev_8_21_14_0_10_42_9]